MSRASAITLLLVVAVTTCANSQVVLNHGKESVLIENEFLQIGFNKIYPKIDLLRADFTGQRKYGENVFKQSSFDPLNLNRSGIVLERQIFAQNPGSRPKFIRASSSAANPHVIVHVVNNSREFVQVVIKNVVDDVQNPILTSDWTISLAKFSRTFNLSVSVSVLNDVNDTVSVRVVCYSSALSVTGKKKTVKMFGRNFGPKFPTFQGMFDRGIVQMMNNLFGYFPSNSSAKRIYGVGGGIGWDIINMVPEDGKILLTGVNQEFYRSGVQHVLAGNPSVLNQWDMGVWNNVNPFPLKINQKFHLSMTIAGSDCDLAPATLSPNVVPSENLKATLIGLYATTLSTINSYIHPSLVAVSVATPDVAYDGLYSFFDPDTWSTLSTLLYTSLDDPYIIDQARKIIETSMYHILPSGQIPHHFIGDTPTYEAISGATQTGPNIFWLISALNYAKYTKDSHWFYRAKPYIDLAQKFLIAFFDPNIKMVKAPGPLWIDRFIRENFTSDSNGMVVYLSEEISELYRFLAENELDENVRAELLTSAKSFMKIRNDIKASMNEFLWDKNSNDHYITELNPDGSTSDFIDYDSNLIAVAFNVTLNMDQAKNILKRIDSNPCSHVMPTWVSEAYYSEINTYGGVSGDSVVSMGRIGYMDALARKFVGDKAFVEKYIVHPIREQVLDITWLPERYTCAGEPSHHMNYHEFPEVLTMVLHDVVYGVSVGFSEITINPMHTKNFHYVLGNSRVTWIQEEENEWEGETESPNILLQVKQEFSASCGPEFSTSFVLEFPNARIKTYKVYQQRSNSKYKIKRIFETDGTISETTVESSNDGVLTFEYFSGKVVGCRQID